MKLGIIALWVAASALGQLRAPARPLGGIAGSAPVTGKPLGGVALPQFPGFPGPLAKNPLTKGYGNRRYSGYVGPIYYIPNAFDYSFDGYQFPASGQYQAQYQSQAQPQVQPPPIIVNQYFGTHAPADDRDAVTQQAPPPEPSSLKPGDPLAEPQNYYLIEYKDHTVYPALTYWVEGDILHYVTTQNTHNQATLNLIDLDKTYKLNEDRSVPFTIPGR